MSTLSERLEGMLDAGQDGALLRFGLGQALHRNGEFARAVEHLARAVAMDPTYSAAWKLLGRAHVDCGDRAAAVEAWRQGIAAATARGDLQAAREMEVFVRRVERAPRGP